MRRTILGQDRAVDTLQAALRSGRVHHAWIFSGPRGVGKRTTALAFAGILLDPAAAPDESGDVAADPDGRAAALIAAGTHPDLHLIHKELALHSADPQLRTRKLTNIPLDVLRQWMIGGTTGDNRTHDGPAYRTATLGHNKVFIVDEAELIDRYGQNALLKTLEEPPPGTYVILVTSRPERLVPTMRSRCQHVRFFRLDPPSLAAWFERAALDVDERDRRWIETYCEGSPGVAQLAAEYGFAGWQRTLDPMLAALEQGRFPPDLGSTLADLVEAFATRWVKHHANASKDAANKDGTGHLLALLGAHARRRLEDAADDAGAAARWARAIDLVAEAEQALAANVNLKHVLENLAAQLVGALGR